MKMPLEYEYKVQLVKTTKMTWWRRGLIHLALLGWRTKITLELVGE